jgi:hypothetical protein
MRPVALALLLCSGCYMRVPDAMESLEGHPRIVAPADKAVVVFLRWSLMPVFSSAPAIMEGRHRLVCTLPGASYCAAVLDPGPHDFTVFGETADMLRTQLAPGRVYVVEVSGRPGALNGRFSFTAWHPARNDMWPDPRASLNRLTATELKDPEPAQQAIDACSQEQWLNGRDAFAELRNEDLMDHTLRPEDGVDHL